MNYRSYLLAAFCSLFILSCQKEDLRQIDKSSALVTSTNKTGTSPVLKPSLQSLIVKLKNAALAKNKTLADNTLAQFIAAKKSNAVVPTECSPTQLNTVVNGYVSQFGSDEFNLYGLYAAVNQLYSFIDESKQYFGAKGENTHLVVKHQRNLEKFWDMPDEVVVNGEHNATLNDRDKIALIFILFGGASNAEAYEIADFFISFNKFSPVFIETPLLSLDGFTIRDPKLIVLGDGLLQILSETGVSSDVVVSGVLAHEWGHQVQFDNWYDASYGSELSAPERTRLTELEADMLSSYYLTHKRGATYNWKRVAEFLNLFYNIGDCAFTSGGHHGTPVQRMAASYLGYIIAKETLPHGHILTALQMHSLYLAAYNDLISNTMTSPQASASLSSAQLKSVYASVLQYEKTINSIIAGKLSVQQISDLK
jgi:hypothetical protein